MNYGIVHIPLIPGREDPSDKSEMITQLLYGECYTVLEVQKKWVLLENAADSYQCWIDRKQYFEIEASEFEKFTGQVQKRCGDAMGLVTDKNGRRFYIPCSAPLPYYSQGSFQMNGNRLEYDGHVARHDSDSPVRHAMRLLHAPYLWGGKSAMGIDCSGFTQVVFACAGIPIPRDAYQQAEGGDTVDFTDLAEPGDVAFFDNEESQITHVGIVLDQGKIIHASGSVRIDTLDHEGIFNETKGEYTHKLRLIKRFNL